MIYNNAIQIKRDILYRTSLALLNSDLDRLNRIPVEAAPRNLENIRCCIHKDRAVIKYRVMAALGYSIEDEIDEIEQLSSYASRIDVSNKADKRILTVIKDACRSCKLGHHYISDVCVGCVARPCTTICPKNAIKVINGRSVIDKGLCIDCGKCTTVCPYNAIVKVPVPCEISCPVDALKKNRENIAEIDLNKCISCGRCLKSCPFGAITEKSQIPYIISELKNGSKINALIAPSIIGQFPGELSQIKLGIKKLGFHDVIDVAESASIVAQKEAKEFIDKDCIMTSSCCPSYMECVDKHLQNMKSNVSHTESPMILCGKSIKDSDDKVINVFIGPCLAKKVEASKSDLIDYVLTFEELGALFMAKNIDVLSLKSNESSINKSGYRFASSGGVLTGVSHGVRDYGVWIKGEALNGLSKKSIKKLKVFNKIPHGFDFLEVMACEGGCINGPGVIVSPDISKKKLEEICKNR